MKQVPSLALFPNMPRRDATRLLFMHAVMISVLLVAIFVGVVFVSPVLSWEQIASGIAKTSAPLTLVMWEFRLPRIGLGVLVGACFGIAGSLLQRSLRNPLASPDVLGISSGASLFATFAITQFALQPAPTSLFALTGATLTVFFLVAITLSRNGISVLDTRFILVGVGVAVTYSAAINMMIAMTSEREIQGALRWLLGTLNGATSEQVAIVATVLLCCIPFIVAVAPSLNIIELGEEFAITMGIRRLVFMGILLGLVVVLTSTATAMSGPVAFVAFASGPIARLLVRGRFSLSLSALTGATMVSLADVAGQMIPGGPYPVGIITSVIGAPLFVYLLLWQKRQG